MWSSAGSISTSRATAAATLRQGERLDATRPPSPHADHTRWSRRPELRAGTGGSTTATTAASTARRTSDALASGTGASGFGWKREQRARGDAVLQRAGTRRGGRPRDRRHAGQRLRCSSTSASWRPFRGGDGGFVAVRSRVRPHDVRRVTSSSRSTARPTGGVSSRVHLRRHTPRACVGAKATRPVLRGGRPQEGELHRRPSSSTRTIPGRLLAGANSLWLTENAKAGTPAWRCHGEGALRPRPRTTSTPIRVAREGNGNISGWGTTTARCTALESGSPPRQLDARRPRRAAGAARATHHHRPRQSSRAIVAFTGFSPSNVWQTPTAAPPGPRSPATCPRAGLRREAPPAHPSWLYAATSVGSLHERDRRRDVVRPTRARPTSACASSSGRRQHARRRHLRARHVQESAWPRAAPPTTRTCGGPGRRRTAGA
jgi:hypothetical protein